jgi:TRAP-type C4-dicarboxylate transport system permease small subunit
MEREQPPAIDMTSPGLVSDIVPDAGNLLGREKPAGPLAKAAYVLGSFGLLAATAADSLAVAGRHTGMHFIGSIELVQAAVVLLAATAMLVVTIGRGHATVHIVTERLSKPAAARLARIADLISAIAFLILAAGSAWVLAELWDGFEQTELLHIPLRWLRLLWVVLAVLVAANLARDALKGRA